MKNERFSSIIINFEFSRLSLAFWRRAEMKRKMHMCLNIEGAIRNAKDLKGCITTDDGVYLLGTDSACNVDVEKQIL